MSPYRMRRRLLPPPTAIGRGGHATTRIHFAATRVDHDEGVIRLEPTSASRINGRLVDLEGRPVSGALVTVEWVGRPAVDGIVRWLADVDRLTKKGALPVPADEQFPRHPSAPDIKAGQFPIEEVVSGTMLGLESIRSDSEGRFTIPVGEDQLVVLKVVADGHTTTFANVLTQDRPPILARAPTRIPSYYLLPNKYHGANCSLVLSPSQPVFGVIRDKATKAPIPGVWVSVNHGSSSVKTDAHGNYRLSGEAPRAVTRLSIYPDPASPYFPEDVSVAGRPGVAPVRRDIELASGIWIEGTVVNRATGKGQSNVTLHYTPFLDNPHADRFTAFDPQVQRIIVNDRRYQTDPSGRFQLLAMHGKGVVMAVCRDGVFRYGVGGAAIAEMQQAAGSRRLTYDNISTRFVSALRPVDIPETKARANVDLEVDPGATLTLHVQDEQGNPLTDYKISGHRPTITQPNQRMAKPQVELQGLQPGVARPVLIRHDGRSIGATLEVTADSTANNDQSVQLLPMATATGRIVDGQQQTRRRSTGANRSSALVR